MEYVLASIVIFAAVCILARWPDKRLPDHDEQREMMD